MMIQLICTEHKTFMISFSYDLFHIVGITPYKVEWLLQGMALQEKKGKIPSVSAYRKAVLKETKDKMYLLVNSRL